MRRKRKTKKQMERIKADPKSSYWMDKADKEWSALVHKEWNERCAFAGTFSPCAGPLQAHHVISRNKKDTRHDPMCGILLCYKHHLVCDACGAHRTAIGFSKALQQLYPKIYKWARERCHNYDSEKPNYRERYEELKRAREQTKTNRQENAEDLDTATLAENERRSGGRLHD